MTCAKTDALLMALHCGEPAEAHCAECGAVLERERTFVGLVERGLTGVRPMASIAAAVRRHLAPRRVRRRSWAPMAAAAVVVVAAGAVVAAFWPRPESVPVEARRRDAPKREPFDRPDTVGPPQGRPVAPSPTPEPMDGPDTPAPEPKPFDRPDTVGPPQGKPPDPGPMPEPNPESPRPTKPEEKPSRAEIAVVVRGGITIEGRKLTGEARVPAGETFKADARTRIEFAGALIQVDGAKARLEAGAFELVEGEIVVDAAANAPIELRLGIALRPTGSVGRFIAVARPGRIWIEEGAAKAGEVVLGERQQWRLDGKATPERATMSWKARPREVVTWTADFGRGKLPAGIEGSGVFAQDALKTKKLDDQRFYFGEAGFFSKELKLFAAKAGTQVQFRYLLRKQAPFVFRAFNVTKSENFDLVFDEPVVGTWTTVTVKATELPPNLGGKRVRAEAGDVFSSVSWMVGRPGEEAEATIDDFRIVER